MIVSSLSLANRLKEVLLDGHWIANTNFREQLQAVSWHQAVQKIGNLNTIAALTYHINYYLEGILNAVETGQLQISDKYSFDLPLLNSEGNWRALVSDFIKNSERFVGWVKSLDDVQLCKPFFDEKYGNYLRNIEGVIEHSYYHLGQVSLIRKMLSNSSFPSELR